MIYFLVSYEGCNSDTLDSLFEDMAGVDEHFDASHVDGSEVYALSVSAEGKDTKKWKKKIQEAVWTVNRGLCADAKVLTEDEFDEYC
jgi:hypothetical protein